jgi:hypothetical protein
MSAEKLLSHLGECRRRLSELRGRQDYLALSCAILRLEGGGGTVLYDQPFSRIWAGRAYRDTLSISHGETFALGFYPVSPGLQASRIPAALAPVEALTREVVALLPRLPRSAREYLRLPDSDNWWRTVFHLAWHFPRPFLRTGRCHLLAREGAFHSLCEETVIQMYGVGTGLADLLPGLIYSDLEQDLCTCSEAAVEVIREALERHGQTGTPHRTEATPVSPEQRLAFDRLRAEFLAGAQLPSALECKLLKLANSFETPPAREWAGLEFGGCVERPLCLSKLNDMQEIARIRGPATEWFCEVAERAGGALPACFLDLAILFDDPVRGFSGPQPVMNRGPLERWVGFVLATLKRQGQEALRVWWGTALGPLSHGLATLDGNLCAASALAIDLAKLTTAAEEASKRERACCSPFSVPAMEEQGVQWPQEMPPPAAPPENYTLGDLTEDLRRFGESYHQTLESISAESPAIQRHSRIQLGAFVSQAREGLQRIPGFKEVRDLSRSLWGDEISFGVCRRIVEALVGRSAGTLSPRGAEGLTLADVAARLSTPAAVSKREEMSATTQPAEQQPRAAGPDGVEGGCWVHWAGKRHDVPKGVVYRLIEFMWGRDSAHYDDLDGPVFEDAIQPDSLRARVSETNKILAKIGLPWRLKTDANSRFLTKRLNAE